MWAATTPPHSSHHSHSRLHQQRACSLTPTPRNRPPAANRSSGEVYLEGTLERGVVPEESYWTHCMGEGEDGCVLTLCKMNLELLQR